jgi:hypothetical protein
MEHKRGTKRSCSPSKEGSSSSSGGSIPPLALSGSPPPSGSPSDISTCRSSSPVFEQDSPSENVSIVDLFSSLNDEGLIPDTSRDEEFAKRHFDDLNRDVLGPPDDDKIIILSDSDEEEEEVHKEDAIDIEAAPSSAMTFPAPTASVDDVDDANKGDTPDWAIGGSSSGGDEVGLP